MSRCTPDPGYLCGMLCVEQVGERLLLQCAFVDVRGGIFRLEEAARQELSADPDVGLSGSSYLGEGGEGEDNEEEGIDIDVGTSGQGALAVL